MPSLHSTLCAFFTSDAPVVRHGSTVHRGRPVRRVVENRWASPGWSKTCRDRHSTTTRSKPKRPWRAAPAIIAATLYLPSVYIRQRSPDNGHRQQDPVSLFSYL